MDRFIGLLGIVSLLGIAWVFSDDRRRIPWRIVVWGIGLQFLFTFLVLGIPALGVSGVLGFLFRWANDAVMAVLSFTDKGAEFLFGALVMEEKSFGFIFAFKVLPTIVFFSSLMAVGYYLGVMQRVVFLFTWLMQKTLRTSGAETLSAAANIFVGQTEAPLMVRPYIALMTRSELLTVMIGGMASTAGGVLAAYVGMLQGYAPDIAGHLMTASVLSAPAAILIAKMLVPETEVPQTQGTTKIRTELIDDANIIDAAARGAMEGLHLALNVGAMLLTFIALIAMLNAMLAGFGNLIGFPAWGSDLVPSLLAQNGAPQLSLQIILGWLFAPLAWLMGIPWHEAPVIGALLGERTALNEFVAYLHLAELGDKISSRSFVITSYALCGFANFSSIAIQVGGIGAMAPNRRKDLAQLGMRSILGGTLATFLTACFAGLVL